MIQNGTLFQIQQSVRHILESLQSNNRLQSSVFVVVMSIQKEKESVKATLENPKILAVSVHVMLSNKEKLCYFIGLVHNQEALELLLFNAKKLDTFEMKLKREQEYKEFFCNDMSDQDFHDMIMEFYELVKTDEKHLEWRQKHQWQM